MSYLSVTWNDKGKTELFIHHPDESDGVVIEKEKIESLIEEIQYLLRGE